MIKVLTSTKIEAYNEQQPFRRNALSLLQQGTIANKEKELSQQINPPNGNW